MERVLKTNSFSGEIIRDNSQYVLIDNTYLEHLVLSNTALKPSQATNGHKHEGQEEVYIFTKGNGVMQVDDKFIPVSEKSIVQIKAGEFHRVINASDTETLVFIAIFEKYTGRGK